MSNILITAPSLDENINISGISSLTAMIIRNNSADHRYFHFRLGKKDSERKGLKWLVNQCLLLPRFIHFVLKNRISFIHLNTDLTPLSLIRDYPLLLLSTWLLRKKVLLHFHGGKYLMSPPARHSVFRQMIFSMLKRSSVKVVLSEIEKKEMLKNYGIYCHVMPNAVEISGKPAAKEFPEKLSLFFMGRIVRCKGIFLIADCLGRLGPWLDEFDLHIYGSGPDTDEFLEKLSVVSGLHYTYHGVVRGHEKNDALTRSHVFLLPSLFGEGLPVALLESMNNGCVPVVSDDASISTVVTDGYNGYMSAKGDAASLTEKLVTLFSNRDQLPRLSSNARSTIQNTFNLDDYITQLNKLYKTLSNNHGTDQLLRHRAKSRNVRSTVQEN